MNGNGEISAIEEKILQLSPVEKWEIMFWASQKLRYAVEKETTKHFESIIYLLPRAVILSFGLEYRCVIFKITDTTYERISEAIPERHFKDRIFPREKMPPPIKELVENEGVNHIYIENALEDERTQYMKQLAKDAGIKDIYYTKVKTPSGIWILVVDGTTKKIDVKKQDFLDMLGLVIRNIEEELAEIRSEISESVKKTKIGVTSFLIRFLQHTIRNKLMAAEWCCKSINNFAVKNGNGSSNGGDCRKCQPKVNVIYKEFRELTKTLNTLSEILHDIEKGEELHIKDTYFSEIFDGIINIDREALVEMEGELERDLMLSTDTRKATKALCRIIDQLILNNKNPVKISIQRIAPGKVKVLITQKDIDTKKLGMLINISPDCRMILDHSFEDFKVFVSATFLSELDVNLKTTPEAVEIIFPEVSTLKRRKTD